MTDIKVELMDLLQKNFHFKEKILWEEIKNIPLVKKPFFFDGVSLYYFFMLVEEKFCIIFEPEEFREDSSIFYTISNVERTIRKKIEEKNKGLCS